MPDSYSKALEVAEAAALAAGEMLRNEFHHAGGPRGGHGKAPAEVDAEQLIRRRLLDAFPGYSYLGEETGRQSGIKDDTHIWLVDPNDGTDSYLKGLRGSAVSIALLRSLE